MEIYLISLLSPNVQKSPIDKNAQVDSLRIPDDAYRFTVKRKKVEVGVLISNSMNIYWNAFWQWVGKGWGGSVKTKKLFGNLLFNKAVCQNICVWGEVTDIAKLFLNLWLDDRDPENVAVTLSLKRHLLPYVITLMPPCTHISGFCFPLMEWHSPLRQVLEMKTPFTAFIQSAVQ